MEGADDQRRNHRMDLGLEPGQREAAPSWLFTPGDQRREDQQRRQIDGEQGRPLAHQIGDRKMTGSQPVPRQIEHWIGQGHDQERRDPNAPLAEATPEPLEAGPSLQFEREPSCGNGRDRRTQQEQADVERHWHVIGEQAQTILAQHHRQLEEPGAGEGDQEVPGDGMTEERHATRPVYLLERAMRESAISGFFAYHPVPYSST